MTVKIIGKFQEVDGKEYETIMDLVSDTGLIGSTASDEGDVRLYYDTNGVTYAVAHDSEDYIGAKETQGIPAPEVEENSGNPLVVSTKSVLWTAGLIAVTIFVIVKHGDAKRHIRNIRS